MYFLIGYYIFSTPIVFSRPAATQPLFEGEGALATSCAHLTVRLHVANATCGAAAIGRHATPRVNRIEKSG